MTYYVKTTTGNGYYCSCCSYNSDYSEKFESLAEALACLPPMPETYSGSGDWVTESVKIEDGATGKDVAEWRMYPIKRGKAIVYWSVTRWHPDEDYQSIVYDSGGKRTTLTFEEACAQVDKEQREAILQNAEIKLHQAEKDYAWAKKHLEQLKPNATSNGPEDSNASQSGH